MKKFSVSLLSTRRQHYIKRVLFVLAMTTCPFGKVLSQEYFQQQANFKIEVILNDTKHELSAIESIEYINNSPDTLSFIYFHLWPNGYSNNKTDLAKTDIQCSG